MEKLFPRAAMTLWKEIKLLKQVSYSDEHWQGSWLMENKESAWHKKSREQIPVADFEQGKDLHMNKSNSAKTKDGPELIFWKESSTASKQHQFNTTENMDGHSQEDNKTGNIEMSLQGYLGKKFKFSKIIGKVN